MLPNFLVIGAYKSGTTSLYRYLAQHPQVFVPRVKEPSYFAYVAAEQEANTVVSRKCVKTLAEYESLFRKASRYVAIGDVSPEYMTSPIAAQAIKKYVPHARLIAILRNPVDRAYSDFLMYRRDGKEKFSDFAKALEMQSDRALEGDPTGFYISTGFYGEQLRRYYDIFPASQIKVFLMEELQTDAPRTLSQVFQFLGVDSDFVPDNLTIYNRSGVASSYVASKLFQYRSIVAPMARRILPDGLRTRIRRGFEDRLKKAPLKSEIRQMLKEVYRADVRLLEQLTGKSCRLWLE